MNPGQRRSHTHFALSLRHERWLVAVSLLLAGSGIGWLICHYWLARPDEFGASRHPLESWWLTLHGAAAMGFLIVFGTVLPVHARRAWHARLNYRSGLTVLGLVSLLVLSGLALYYLASEALRPWLSATHWIAGLVGVAVLIVHAVLGRRTAARAAQARSQRRHDRGHARHGVTRN